MSADARLFAQNETFWGGGGAHRSCARVRVHVRVCVWALGCNLFVQQQKFEGVSSEEPVNISGACALTRACLLRTTTSGGGGRTKSRHLSCECVCVSVCGLWGAICCVQQQKFEGVSCKEPVNISGACALTRACLLRTRTSQEGGAHKN